MTRTDTHIKMGTNNLVERNSKTKGAGQTKLNMRREKRIGKKKLSFGFL